MAGLNNFLKDILKSNSNYLNNISYIDKEQWKYTDIKKFLKIRPDGLVKNNLVEPVKFKNNKINFRNNQINNIINNNKFFCSSLKYAINENLESCTKKFNKIIPNDCDFIRNNTRYIQDGIFIHIKKNTTINNPIYISDMINQEHNDAFCNTRYFFSFGKNVNIQIIMNEKFIEKNNLNTVYELFIDENSNVDFIFEIEKPETIQIFNFGSEISKNSSLNFYQLAISSKYLKNNFFISLCEQNSSFNYYGINLLKDKNHIDNYIKIYHKNKFTFSNTTQKNILNNKSTGIFYSKAIINKNCSNVEAYQKNNNIMLSSQANAYSIPQLEIYNNDVKCSHGSTTGTLNEDALFYLRTRGLNIKSAKKVLINGFIKESIKSIKSPLIIDNLNNQIDKWLDNNVN